jgi:hypothetical protein
MQSRIRPTSGSRLLTPSEIQRPISREKCTDAIRGERLENEWMVFASGKQEGRNRFYLPGVKD